MVRALELDWQVAYTAPGLRKVIHDDLSRIATILNCIKGQGNLQIISGIISRELEVVRQLWCCVDGLAGQLGRESYLNAGWRLIAPMINLSYHRRTFQ